MADLLIRNAILDGSKRDVLIRDGLFAAIEPSIDPPENVPVLDADGKLLVPAFYNGHTHSAMTLLRSYADDLRLFDWLNDHIWPAEAKLTTEAIEAGIRLAVIEMIHSGTVFFNDSYWEPAVTLRVAEESGLRAAIGRFHLAGPDGKDHPRCERGNAELVERYADCPDKARIRLACNPHAVYTVPGPLLRELAAAAEDAGEIFHIHASETAQEVADCRKAHGMSPIAWIDACGGLGPRTVLAHCVHVSPEDIALIRDRGATIVHNPCSNYKLASGQFPFRAIREEGHCRVALGTDGCASNNNLSFFDEMKLAALNAKIQANDPTSCPAGMIWSIATREGALAMGLDGGAIEVGRLGDAVLLDPRRPCLTPLHNLAADVVYSADTSCVDTVICDGRPLMRDGVIPGEEEVLARVESISRHLFA